MKKDLTSGSIFKALVTLSVPIVFSNLLQTAYQLTDTFWVGRLGAPAVAAVSLSFPIIFLLISLGGGLAIAGTILVAQFAGQKNQEAINHTATQTFIMMALSAITVSIIGFLLTPTLIRWMGGNDPAVFAGATSYLRISFVGLIFIFGYFVAESMFRGVGNAKTPLWIVLSTVLLNLVLDPLFIRGYGPIPAMGVSGAALATILTQAIAMTIGIILLLRGKHGLKINLDRFTIDKPLVKKMFFLGLPTSIEQSARALGFVALTFLVATFATETIAIFGIGGRVLSFIIIPAIGFSIATSTLVGQNIGAQKLERVDKTVMTGSAIIFITLTTLGILFFIFARQIATFFIPNEPAVIEGSVIFIRIMAFSFGLMGVEQVLTGAFRGSGDTVSAMMISIIVLWLIQIPAAFLLSRFTALDAVGIWWSIPIANICGITLAAIWFFKGTWKHKRITADYKMQEKTSEEIIVNEGSLQ